MNIDKIFRDHWQDTWAHLTEKEPLSGFGVTRTKYLCEAHETETEGEDSEDVRLYVANTRNRDSSKGADPDMAKRPYVSPKDYRKLKERAGNRCEMCGEPPSGTKRRSLNIDHCHTSGRIRGLLCHRCNTGLGFLESKPEWLEKAFGYLQQF